MPPVRFTANRELARRSGHKRVAWIAPWLAWLAVTGLVEAQVPARSDRAGALRDPDSFLNQQRAIEERLRREFDAEVGEQRRAALDWGGWFNFHLFLFDDGIESSRTLRRYDLRLWGRLTLDEGAHDFYVRTRASLLDFNSGDSYDGRDDDTQGPNLERGVYRFDLARAMQAYEGRVIDYNVVVTAGRDLVELGTGLALSTPLDHVSVRGSYRDFDLTVLAGKTVGSSVDIDLSRSASRTRRNFLGGELRYTGLERHRPFLYTLWQRDRNRERFFWPFQEFDYDSAYFGLGSTGEVVPRLRYSTELVYETGESYGHRQFLRRNDVSAWAFDAALEYLFPGRHKTRASIEYLFGSGDGDRFASPTNSVGGNRGDRRDTSFVGFGYRDTGLSFAPRISNLHMIRSGASFFPWPEDERFRHLELGTDWYVYHKHHRDGAVSDPTANVRSGYLGWEMDYFANWRMTADLAWTTRFGVFFPGSAFDDQSTRTFVLFGVTYSF
jgi:hypothetical protein